jgi:spore maturation protein CgeB
VTVPRELKKILYVGMKWDYGEKSRGLSFEQTNFYDCLAHMPYQVRQFDFMTIFAEQGKKKMNELLLKEIDQFHPDLVFFCLFTDQFEPAVLKNLQSRRDVTTYNWFSDDHWRFDNFTKDWAPLFNWISTTDSASLPKYRSIGYKNVIKTQWACNHFLYKKLPLPLKYDVTFIGQPHGNRRLIIDEVRGAGVDVKCWGYGWETGRISQEEMIKIFNESRINLNLSNASVTGGRKDRLKRLLMPWRKKTDQIKGRNFEIPGCGGFQLSGKADNLEDYFIPDKEIALFGSTSELIDKIKYYLSHEKERQDVANAGYRRTLKEHTYEKRFNDIFRQMGFDVSKQAR